MDFFVFAVVLFAALLHATWNAFVKVDSDRLLFMGLLSLGGAVGAIAAIPFLPAPAPESWPYILASVILHQGYIVFLLLAYRYGDLSHVYPLARGSAPLIVAMLSLTLIGEQLSQSSTFAVLIMGAGIMSLSLTRGAQNLWNPTAVLFALGTGLFIACYTLVDGVGARLAGSPHSYSAWLFGLEWIPITTYALWKRRNGLTGKVARVWRPAMAAGLMALAGYWMVIWAMSVAPIALVAALRETSIIFAVLFGVIILKERLSLARLAATFMTLTGTVLLKVSRP